MANTSLLPHKLPACDWRSSLVGGARGLFFWSSYFFTSRKNKRKKFVYFSKEENDRNNGIIVCVEANEVAVPRSTETAACFSAQWHVTCSTDAVVKWLVLWTRASYDQRPGSTAERQAPKTVELICDCWYRESSQPTCTGMPVQPFGTKMISVTLNFVCKHLGDLIPAEFL